jgi:hypothetical protein
VQGREVLLLADIENLDGGARDLGCKMRYESLTQAFRQAATRCAFHAFFTLSRENEQGARNLPALGWSVHARPMEVVRTHRGLERRTNSDNLILFHAGALVTRSTAEVVVIASGDGNLASDLAREVVALPKKRLVLTMSLAGSTSWRLDARTNGHIAGNIEVGRDCLCPL